MEGAETDKLVREVARRLSAVNVNYAEKNYVGLARLLATLCDSQRAGEASVSAAELLERTGLSAKRLSGYLRNLERIELVEGAGSGKRHGLPHPAFVAHVAELLDDAQVAAATKRAEAVPVGQPGAASRAGVRVRTIGALGGGAAGAGNKGQRGDGAAPARGVPVPLPQAAPMPQAAPLPRTGSKGGAAGLNSELLQSGYLASHPERRARFGSELASLSAWLDAHPEPPEQLVHVNERSYEIFNNEKLLSDEKMRRTLSGMRISDERLGIMPSRSCYLFAVAPHLSACPTVLLVENQAPYDSLSHLLAARRVPLELCGERIDAVLHSNGAAVNSLGRIEEYVASFGLADVRLLYWGDIDRSGVFELESACATASRPIEPFLALYELCLDAQLARLRLGVPIEGADDAATSCDVERFASLFSGIYADLVRVVLLNGLRVPQEIVTRTDLEALLPPAPHFPGARVLGRVARAAGFAAGALGRGLSRKGADDPSQGEHA